MEDGGRQMQDDMERIREELAAAEDRNRMLAEQVRGGSEGGGVPHIMLRVPYALSGTDLGVPYAMSGTDLRVPYAMPGADQEHAFSVSLYLSLSDFIPSLSLFSSRPLPRSLPASSSS
eukprot:1824449-Rhodomonas_salina.1